MGKAGDDIPMQIDSIQFDMRNGMQHGDAAQGAGGPAARHIAGREQIRLFGPCGLQGRLVVADRQWMACRAGRKPCGCVFAPKGGLGAAIGGGQHLDGHLRQRLGHRFSFWAPLALQVGQNLGRMAFDLIDLPDMRDFARAVDQEG